MHNVEHLKPPSFQPLFLGGWEFFQIEVQPIELLLQRNGHEYEEIFGENVLH